MRDDQPTLVGRVEHLHRKARAPGVPRGIPKHAVDSIEIVAEGVVGDHTHYRSDKLAGDPDQATLLLPGELLDAFRGEGWPIEPGHFGENLTTRGIPNDAFVVGQRWRIGAEVELQITRACDPCAYLAVLPYVGKERVAELIRASLGRRGWYARVLRPGVVQVGDPLRTVPA
ncbi:MAG: hypothetical protein NVSMB47_15910 [Polyangiales bacterium]